PQLLADELVVVLGVGDRRLQQLQPRLGGAARREREDRARLGDVLAADVVAHQPRLAGGGAHVLGLGADGQPDGNGGALVALAAGGLGRLGGLGLLGRRLVSGLLAAGARALGGLDRLVGGLLGLVGGGLGLACLARARLLGRLGDGLRRLLGLLRELLGLLGA